MDIQLALPIIAVAGTGAALVGAASVFGIRAILHMGQFSYHNARLSTMGNPYVSREEVLPLVDIRDPLSLVKMLQGDLDRDEVSTFREADSILMRWFHGSIEKIASDSPRSISQLLSAFMDLWEVEELKRLIRLIGQRRDPLFPIGRLDREMEERFLRFGSLSEASEVLEDKFGNMISSMSSDREGGMDKLDSLLDHSVLEGFFNMSGLPFSCRKGVKSLSSVLVDKYNLHVILRSRVNGWSREEVIPLLFRRSGSLSMQLVDQMIDTSTLKDAFSLLNGTYMGPYFREAADKGPMEIETAIDRMVLDASISISHSFGMTVGPTIRFLISREMEMKNLRILLRAAFSKWSPDRTKEHLILEGVVG